jgi:hypothetical protein
MENFRNIEVVLFLKLPLSYNRQQELLEWLATTMQLAICKQQEKAKTIYPGTLDDTPAIYMS